MHLSTLLAAKKEFLSANELLKEAKKSRLKSDGKREQIAKISAIIDTLLAATARTAAIKLKLQLTARAIVRDKWSKSAYTKEGWREYIKKEIEAICKIDRPRFDSWAKAAGGRAVERIFAYLNSDEALEERIALLDSRILNLGRIVRYNRQIVYNVQDVSRGRRVGGMTGTLCRDALYGHKSGSSYAKEAMGFVLLEAALLEGPPSIAVAKSSLSLKENQIFEKVKEQVKVEACKAVINQGFDFSGLSTDAIVELLREEAPERIFLYIDKETERYTIWEPGADKRPKQIGKRDLNKMMENEEFRKKAFAFFSPKDTRGTDFRLPPGYAVALVSDKCTDLVQP